MKTAMQELIDEIKEAVPYFKLDIYQPNFNKALEKEKLQIELAHTTGYNDCYKYHKGLTNLVTPKGATEYYNETYKNETP
jgi:cation transport regulator ChaB